MRVSASRIAFLVLASLSPAIAQFLSVGVKAGVRIRDEFSSEQNDLNDESKRYTVGPMVDLRLPLRLGIELDALYSPLGYTAQNLGNFFHRNSSRERSNSWEFPIVAKHRLPGAARGAPYVGIGYAPRIVYGTRVDTFVLNDLSGMPMSATSTTRDTDYVTTHGLLIEGGLSLPALHFHVSPEIRYTRWNTRFLTAFGAHAGYFSRQNQVEVLFGLTWH
jgi:hypothetical protein